jgi:molybdate transport system substrate-binding protein
MPRLVASLVAFVLMTHAAAAQPVQLYSAGSLKGAWFETIGVFGMATGIKVEPHFGPSGALKDEIVGGAKADVFTSANMEHPQALAAAHLSGPVIAFAGNRLCALARPGLDVTPATLLDRMLDPAVKLATSTPKADPAGDYAWEVFHKADAVLSGAFAQLDKKALQLVGRPDSPIPADGRSAYGALLAQGEADLFLAYCTAGQVAQGENPALQVIALPPELAVGADYGLTVLNNAPPDAYKFAMFILSADGQRILTKAGFNTLMLP